MKKLLILGSSGMAGHMILKYLTSLNKYAIFNVARTEVNEHTEIIDLETNRSRLRHYIEDIRPDFIINCVGVLVKPSADNPQRALWLNTELPRWLANITEFTHTKVIHLSTDCVFSGENGPYKDTDKPDGKGRYAETKEMGEIINDRDLTIRMSIIGPELKENGSGLFEWFMRQTKPLQGYKEVFWSGVTTLELAIAIDKLIPTNITGLIQLAPSYSISKYDLLKTIAKVWNKDINIIPTSLVKHNKVLIPSEVKIPYYEMPNSYESMLLQLKEFTECST